MFKATFNMASVFDVNFDVFKWNCRQNYWKTMFFYIKLIMYELNNPKFHLSAAILWRILQQYRLFFLFFTANRWFSEILCLSSWWCPGVHVWLEQLCATTQWLCYFKPTTPSSVCQWFPLFTAARSWNNSGTNHGQL